LRKATWSASLNFLYDFWSLGYGFIKNQIHISIINFANFFCLALYYKYPRGQLFKKILSLFGVFFATNTAQRFCSMASALGGIQFFLQAQAIRRRYKDLLGATSESCRANVCYLQDFFTAPEVRGQGIGKSLIEAVYARARTHGAARVYWQTHETNETAKSLYNKVAENSGFIVYRKQL